MTRTKRSRGPPSPKPILDRAALLKALENSDISLKTGHLDAFYQLLHIQHYPPLPEFVETYYKNERGEIEDAPQRNLPLKNPVSARKKNGGKQLPRRLLEFLKDSQTDFCTVTSKVQCARTSSDGTTTKLAVQLHDGHIVESVIMRYTNKGKSRATLCVSSQVGCAMACTFCATGTMGIRRDLNCGEILEQLVHAGRILAEEAASDPTQEQSDDRTKKPDLVRNVVFMGMGEPLNNYNNVIEACRSLIDCKRWNLSHGRVTVSTVGVTPKIRKLTRDLPEVSLALSLHAPNQAMRSAIVPAAKHYPIEGLIDALDAHMTTVVSKNRRTTDPGPESRNRLSRRKKAMIEYVMLEGDTSSFECAHQLGRLCENRSVVVNLIPYNQTDVADKLKCPSRSHMKEFSDIVSSYGVLCTLRRTMGADITGACGQLVVQEEKKTLQSSVKDIEDGPFANRGFNSGQSTVGTSMQSRVAQPTEDVSGRSAPDTAVRSHGDTVEDADGKDARLEEWIQPLTIATSVAAACFLVSSFLFLSQKNRR